MVINRFLGALPNGNGVLIQNGGGNVIEGNLIGADVTGMTVRSNAQGGVTIMDSTNNLIGGTSVASRNIVSGNGFGITILNSNTTSTTGNLVQGNFIGTDRNGTGTLSNLTYGVGIGWIGSIAVGASNNTVGGTSVSARNIISGNGKNGVYIAVNSSANLVRGNYIGTDVTGNFDLGNNESGVLISNALNNVIGGTNVTARNVISGNGPPNAAHPAGYGIHIIGANAKNNFVEGNFIGVDVTGSVGLGNARAGIFINGAPNNTIGGAVFGAGNVVSGNAPFGGIYIEFAAATGNQVQGNYIGTDASGTSAVSNVSNGVVIDGSSNNLIGGTNVFARNVISGNAGNGVGIGNYFSGQTPVGNLVQGNFIGIDATGTNALGNGGDGVQVFPNSSVANTVGGTNSGEGNVISANTSNGVSVFLGSGAVFVTGDFIGTDATGTQNLGNGRDGLLISSVGPFSATAGAAADSAAVLAPVSSDGRGLIAFNGRNGATIITGSGLRTDLRGYNFFSNARLGIDLVGGSELPSGVTTNDYPCDADSGPNSLQNFPDLTSVVSGAGATTIQGSLNSAANTTFALEFFTNTQCDPSGYGEGETFIGTTNVITAGNCFTNFTVTFPVAVPLGSYVTATATRSYGPGQFLETSEFSQCRQVVARDTDGDGMPDDWEILYGLNPNDGSDAALDADGDGLSNLQEYLAGTNPKNPNSGLRILSVTRSNNDVRITWATDGGRTNQLQLTTGGPGGNYTNNFTDIGPQIIIPGTGDAVTNRVDTGGATNKPARYYRVRLVP